MQEEYVVRNSPNVSVMPLSTQMKAMHIPTHKIIKKSEKNGLKCDSCTIGESVRSISKSRLLNQIGELEQENFSVVGEALLAQFPMTKYAVK